MSACVLKNPQSHARNARVRTFAQADRALPNMKIVLAEDRNGQLHGERSFATERVLVGRDPAVCHYFFSQEQWPMVSRKHAEFRLGDGRVTIVDTNSRFGTYLNGQQIKAPVEVRVGAQVQFGTGGPILRVVSIEQTPVAAVDPSSSGLRRMETFRDPGMAVDPAPITEPPAPPKPSPPPRTPSPPARTSPAYLDLVDSRTGQTRRIELSKDVTRLGRDPEAEIVIDADAAVVSRRHAEIKKSGEQYTITDLKSFNGTLVNNQRISDTVPLFDREELQLGNGGPTPRLSDQSHPAPPHRIVQPGAPSPSQNVIPEAFGQIAAIARGATIVSTSGTLQPSAPASGAQPQLLARLSFETRPQLSVGRATDNDVRLDGLQI